MLKNKVPGHKKGVTWDLKTKAKISTSRILKRETDPRLWDKLFRVTLERMKILQEIHGSHPSTAAKEFEAS